MECSPRKIGHAPNRKPPFCVEKRLGMVKIIQERLNRRAARERIKDDGDSAMVEADSSKLTLKYAPAKVKSPHAELRMLEKGFSEKPKTVYKERRRPVRAFCVEKRLGMVKIIQERLNKRAMACRKRKLDGSDNDIKQKKMKVTTANSKSAPLVRSLSCSKSKRTLDQHTPDGKIPTLDKKRLAVDIRKFSTDTKRQFLAAFVPETMTVADVLSEPTWHLKNQVTDSLVEKTFSERFSGVPNVCGNIEVFIERLPEYNLARLDEKVKGDIARGVVLHARLQKFEKMLKTSQRLTAELERTLDATAMGEDSVGSTVKRIILTIFVQDTITDHELLDEPKWHLEKQVSEQQVEDTFRKRFALPFALHPLSKMTEMLEHQGLTTRSNKLREIINKSRHSSPRVQRLITLSKTGKTQLLALEKSFTDQSLVEFIISQFQYRGNQLAATGGSSYAEPTLTSTKKIAAELAQSLQPDDVVVDFGHGVGTTLFLLCHFLRCNGIGVENDNPRHRVSCSCNISLLRAYGSNRFLNPNVATFQHDILKITRMPVLATILFLYDEVFIGELMDHIETLLNRPNNVRVIVSMKASKRPSEGAIFLGAGFEEVRRIPIAKHGSGEKSTAIIYKRENFPKVVPSPTMITRLDIMAHRFWSLPTGTKLKAKRLELSILESTLPTKRTNRRLLHDGPYQNDNEEEESLTRPF